MPSIRQALAWLQLRRVVRSDRKPFLNFAVSSARVDITPGEPVPLAGYAGRDAAFVDIASRLEANAVLLACGPARVLFVALDALYFGPVLSRVVRESAARHGIGADCVVSSASHTHFAPATDPGKPALGRVDPAWIERVAGLLEQLVDRVAAAPTQPATIEALRIEVPLNVNRRRRWRWPMLVRAGLRLGGGIVMAPAPLEPRDQALDLLRVRAADGQVLAWLWKYACHPVGSVEPLRVDAEYPGRVREALRALGDAAAAVVFWQGFAGDVRPWIVGRRSLAQRLATLRRGPDFGRPRAEDWQRWCSALVQRVRAGVGTGPWRAISATLTVRAERIALTELLEAAGEAELPASPLLVQRLCLGQEIDLLFLSAEVCSPYLRLARLERTTICAGYTDDPFGYLPSAAQVAEGGYEASGFLRYFGPGLRWRPGFEQRVEAAVVATERDTPAPAHGIGNGLRPDATGSAQSAMAKSAGD